METQSNCTSTKEGVGQFAVKMNCIIFVERTVKYQRSVLEMNSQNFFVFEQEVSSNTKRAEDTISLPT